MSIASSTELYQSKFLHINISKQLKKRDYYYHPRSPGQAMFSVEIQFLPVLASLCIMSFHYCAYCSFSTSMVHLLTTCSILLRVNTIFSRVWKNPCLKTSTQLFYSFLSACVHACGHVHVSVCVYVCVHVCVQVCKHVYVASRDQCQVFLSITSALLLSQGLSLKQ